VLLGADAGLGTGGVAFAEQWVASGLAALAVAAVPIWAAVFAGLWGRWPRRMEWVGLGVGLAGVALLNMENGMQASPLGALVLIIAPMSWAFGSIWSRRLSLPDGLMASAVEMLGGSASLMLLSVVFRESPAQLPSGSSALAVVYLVVFGSLIAFSAYVFLLRAVRPVLATSYAYANPVVAVLLGVLLAGEHITPLGVAAMLVILSGVALLTLAKEKGS
jgi:drug/metabolite transporter (DMT)-like permease